MWRPPEAWERFAFLLGRHTDTDTSTHTQQKKKVFSSAHSLRSFSREYDTTPVEKASGSVVWAQLNDLSSHLNTSVRHSREMPWRCSLRWWSPSVTRASPAGNSSRVSSYQNRQDPCRMFAITGDFEAVLDLETKSLNNPILRTEKPKVCSPIEHPKQRRESLSTKQEQLRNISEGRATGSRQTCDPSYCFLRWWSMPYGE